MSPYLTLILLVGSLLVILSFLASLFWFASVAIPLFFQAAPWVPSGKKRVQTMIRLAKLQPTDHVVDMGSGDGILLFAAMKAGAKSAEGYEINPILATLCRLRLKQKRLAKRVTIHRRSLFQADLSKTDVLLLYQLPNCMARLSHKLKRELPQGARIVSNSFPFPDWVPSAEENKVYLYEM